jgi:hypothetical protein
MNRTRGASVIAATLAFVLTASSCSGDDDTAATTSTPRVTSTMTEPSTTVASSTIEPSTPSTSSTSTVAPTTAAPTTTIDEVALTKQAVAEAAVLSRENYLYAVRNYFRPTALRRLARTTVRDSPSWDLTLQNIETLRSNGWRSRENPDVPSTLTVEGDVDLLDGPPATRAELTVCVIDSGVVYEPGGAPDGSDTIVNDEITANRNRITMVLEDGSWKLFDGTGLQSWNGSTTCPAA